MRAAPHLQFVGSESWRQAMIRQFVVAVVLGLGLSACGVEAGEELVAQNEGLEDSGGAVATSQDPVPPSPDPVTYEITTDHAGNIVIIAVASPAPSAPGDESASSQDPIPPKIHRPNEARVHRQ